MHNMESGRSLRMKQLSVVILGCLVNVGVASAVFAQGSTPYPGAGGYYGQPATPRLGAYFVEYGYGAMVQSLIPGSPATRFVHYSDHLGGQPVVTSLAPGDVIQRVDGIPIYGVEHLRSVIASRPSGQPVWIEGLDAAYGRTRGFRGYVIFYDTPAYSPPIGISIGM